MAEGYEDFEKLWKEINALKLNAMELSTRFKSWSEESSKDIGRIANEVSALAKIISDFRYEYQQLQIEFITLKTRFADKRFMWVSIGSIALSIGAIIAAVIIGT